MSHDELESMSRGRLRRILGLGVSGAALVGLVYFEGLSSRAEASADLHAALEADEADEADERVEADAFPEADAVETLAINVLPASGAAPGVERTVGMAVAVAVAEASDLPPPAPVATMVVVPDVTGMSLRNARGQLKAAGLRLSARDGYGSKVDPLDYAYYRVRGQTIEAGTEVELHSLVSVKARERIGYAQGY